MATLHCERLTAMGSSSVVNLELVIGERTIPLWQTGRKYVRTESPITLPDCDGIIVITVDGRRREHPVKLLACKDSFEIRYEDL